MNRGDRSEHEFDRLLRRRDLLLTPSYLAGLALAVACLSLPFRLSQLGAGLLIVTLVHMISRICQAHFSQLAAGARAEWTIGQGTHPRVALAESVLFYVPFLAGVNLVFMGIPLGQDALAEAIWDCWFLGCTVALLFISFCWNQRAVRELEICVGSKAIESSRSQ